MIETMIMMGSAVFHRAALVLLPIEFRSLL